MLYWQLAAKDILSICQFVCDHILKVCEHDIFQTACRNFTKFAT